MQEIGRFLKTFGGQLDANDIAEPLESFNTFNQFFFRKLKPSARPIAEPIQDHVVVSTRLLSRLTESFMRTHLWKFQLFQAVLWPWTEVQSSKIVCFIWASGHGLDNVMKCWATKVELPKPILQ